MRAHAIIKVLVSALLFASTGSQSWAIPPDADFDGMEDSWEVSYFGHISNCVQTIDWDLDGHNNRQEFVCGTDPTNSASCFNVASSGMPGCFVLNWSSVSGRVYYVFWTADLTNGFSVLASDLGYPLNSYTDTVHAAEAAGFYSVGAQYDFVCIDQCWRILESMHAWSQPSSEAVTNWFDLWVASGFVEGGETATDIRDEWISDGLPIGISLSVEVIEPMDVSGTSYVTGYWGRLHYSWAEESGSFLSSMVFNGTNWLWFGDQRWLGIDDFDPHAQMQVDSGDATNFYTGFQMSLWDDSLYAYNQGARSAIITGPGLPVSGQVLEHYYPEAVFRLYPKGGWPHPSGGWGLWLDDSTISTIPENANYTVRLYAEDAAVVSLANTPLKTYTKIVEKRPVLNADLNASLFPTLTVPSSHDNSLLNIPGLVDVTWTNPANMLVDYMNLGLYSSGAGTGGMVSTHPTPGAASAVLDTTGWPSDTEANQLFLLGDDAFERSYGLGWEFY